MKFSIKKKVRFAHFGQTYDKMGHNLNQYKLSHTMKIINEPLISVYECWNFENSDNNVGRYDFNKLTTVKDMWNI